MIIVGLTGGIASGKSFVVSYLKRLGYSTHESDKVVLELYESRDKNLVTFLTKNGFKESVLKKKINKKCIREIIFSNNKKKKILENYLHKLVRKSRNLFLRYNRKNKEKIVFLDIPLLFENDLEFLCDIICSTIAPIRLRENRALQRLGMNKGILKKIIKYQVNDKCRKKKSNYLIDTSKTKRKTYLQVESIIYDVLNK